MLRCWDGMAPHCPGCSSRLHPGAATPPAVPQVPGCPGSLGAPAVPGKVSGWPGKEQGVSLLPLAALFSHVNNSWERKWGLGTCQDTHC